MALQPVMVIHIRYTIVLMRKAGCNALQVTHVHVIQGSSTFYRSRTPARVQNTPQARQSATVLEERENLMVRIWTLTLLTYSDYVLLWPCCAGVNSKGPDKNWSQRVIKLTVCLHSSHLSVPPTTLKHSRYNTHMQQSFWYSMINRSET